jgi:hypothetical protein
MNHLRCVFVVKRRQTVGLPPRGCGGVATTLLRVVGTNTLSCPEPKLPKLFATTK